MSLEKVNMHHYMHPKRDFTGDPFKYKVRTNPINIEQATIEKHKELHHRMMGKMAVMSGKLALELIDFYKDLPVGIGADLELRKIWFDKQIDHLASLAVSRSVIIGQEASFWAKNLETQRNIIR